MANEAMRELTDARLVTLEGAAHFPFLDQPEAFVEAVTSFLGEGPAP